MVVIALLCAAQALPAGEHGSAGERMAELFNQEFKYDPEAYRRARERDLEVTQRADEAGGETVTLPTMIVRDRSRRAAEAVDRQRVRIEDEEFDWRDGGTIRKWEGRFLNPELRFKYNPEHNGIDLLNFSW